MYVNMYYTKVRRITRAGEGSQTEGVPERGVHWEDAAGGPRETTHQKLAMLFRGLATCS